jgi:hypothetical protein
MNRLGSPERSTRHDREQGDGFRDRLGEVLTQPR